MQLDANRLWAKSEREVPSMCLPVHLSDVYCSAERVLEATVESQLKAVGLDVGIYEQRMRNCVLLSSAIHDLGKANNHFQEMILRTRNVRINPQGLRHEWVTIVMLKHLRNWLLPAVDGSEIDFEIVQWAVAGHHPAHYHASPPRLCPPGAGAEITLLMGHDDFQRALTEIKNRWPSLDDPQTFSDFSRNLVGSNNMFAELARWHRDALQIWDELKKTPDARLVPAVKNCLIAADIAGSALPTPFLDDPQPWNWITDSFADKPLSGDLQAVVDFRLQTSTSQGGSEEDNKARKRFQDNVAASSAPTTYLKAGCGTGKTVAAYMWAAKNYPLHRLYFCYPTTGTATEGFKDYLFAPECNPDENDPDADRIRQLGANLFHGRSSVDFEIILETGPDAKSSNDGNARLESLKAWKTPVVACTVDTVLGIVQNNKRGLYAWPALAQSAFVFDEIHAYDDRLFGALLRFIRDLPGLPMLLMTASLPTAREEALRNIIEKMGREFSPILGPAILEERPRYHIQSVAGNDPLSVVKKTIHGGEQVLWVCNTVGRAMDFAERAKSLDPFIYHSRFRYHDRVNRHKAVIDAFDLKNQNKSALAICSQVAEMSLDLSADLLVTDLAPVPALIQRLGRLNRRAKKGAPTKPFIVVEPDNHLPYTPAELDAARMWLSKLAELPAQSISQQQLANCWEQTGDQPPDLVPSAWLDGGPTTTVTELREASPGITALLDSDGQPILDYQKRVANELAKARKAGQPPHPSIFVVQPTERHPNDRIACAIPMPPPPKNLDWRSWQKVNGLFVAEADAIIYDSMRGAKWQRNK